MEDNMTFNCRESRFTTMAPPSSSSPHPLHRDTQIPPQRYTGPSTSLYRTPTSLYMTPTRLYRTPTGLYRSLHKPIQDSPIGLYSSHLHCQAVLVVEWLAGTLVLEVEGSISACYQMAFLKWCLVFFFFPLLIPIP